MAETPTVPKQQLTDARFLAVLRHITDAVVDATGEGRNGEVMVRLYQPLPADAPWDAVPEEMSYSDWLEEQIDTALLANDEQVRAMLDARARLGQNIRLVEDIKLDRIRTALLDPDEALAVTDDIGALLDFVDEVRKIAKEI